MKATIIITFCSLFLIAYLFELTSSKTKVPSVILLLLLGWIVRQITIFLNIALPDLSLILPIIASIGLILIVLEGSLEIELNKSKVIIIKKSLLGALIPTLILSFSFAFLFLQFGDHSFKDSLINAIPFCVISSAIAIPSVMDLSSENKEFVIYESSLTDIIGVLFFNFIVLNDNLDLGSFGIFSLQFVIIIIISFVATIGLSFLLSKIEHHIKFVPIIFLIILIYEIAKFYHLPALIFILLFGLALGNLDQLRKFKIIEKFHPEELNEEAVKFKELTIEVTFLIRTLFFLLFGYLLETSDVLNLETLVWSVGIVFAIYSIRAIQLKISNLPLKPLLFIAPRGLITILLFLSITPGQQLWFVNKSMIIQVIILTSLIMMYGIMTNNKKDNLETISS